MNRRRGIDQPGHGRQAGRKAAAAKEEAAEQAVLLSPGCCTAAGTTHLHRCRRCPPGRARQVAGAGPWVGRGCAPAGLQAAAGYHVDHPEQLQASLRLHACAPATSLCECVLCKVHASTLHPAPPTRINSRHEPLLELRTVQRLGGAAAAARQLAPLVHRHAAPRVGQHHLRREVQV